MKIAFYAFDVGPGKNHALVANEAAQRGHAVTMHVNGGRGDLDILAAKPDVLVTAISSFKGDTEEMPVGLRAAELGIPWIVFCDSHETWARPAMREHAGKVTAVLVAHPDETLLAAAWGYPNLGFLGYPPVWGQFLRERQNEITFASEAKILALVGGTKQPELTNNMLASTIRALQSTFGDRFAVAPRFHPHEDPPKDPAERERILEGVRLADTSAFRAIEPLAHVADLIVTTGGATITIYGALLRKRVIHYIDDAGILNERMQTQLGKVGWFPVDQGCAEVAYGVEGLETAVKRLLTREGSAESTKRQVALYPDEEIKRAIEEPTERKIVDFLERKFGPKK